MAEEIKDPFEGMVDPFASSPPVQPAAAEKPAPRTRGEHLAQGLQPWKHVANEFMEGQAKFNPFSEDYQKERDEYLKEVSDTPWYDIRPEIKRTLKTGAGVAQALFSPITGPTKSLEDLGNAAVPPPTPEEEAEFKKKGLPIPPGGGKAVSDSLAAVAPSRWGATWRSAGKPPPSIAPEPPTPPAVDVTRPSDVVLSKGQETGELPLIQREQAAAQGTSGKLAHKNALDFFEGQQKPQVAQAEEAVRESLRPGPSMTTGIAAPREAAESIVDALTRTHDTRTQQLTTTGQALERAQETIREMLSPTGAVLARTPDEAAQIVSQSVGAADDAARAATNDAYRRFEELPGQFHPASFNNAANELRFRIASPENLDRRLSINPEATPTAERVFKELPEIIKGLTQRRDPETGRVLGGEVPLTPRRVELVRQWLNSELGTARGLRDKPKDAQAMRRVIDEFDDLVARKLRTTFTGGDPEAVIQGIEQARGLYSAHRQAYHSQGSGDVVGPVIQKILGRHEGQALTPEQVAKQLYESANSKPVADRLLRIFEDAPEVQGALKQGLYSHIIEAPPGKAPYTPAQVADRIERFTRGSGRSVTEAYLDRSEIDTLRRYGQYRRDHGNTLDARVDPVDRALRRMTGADGNARASIDDTMGSLFGAIQRGAEYAPEMVRRLTTGAGALPIADQAALREGTLRYAMQAPKGEEAYSYKRMADNLHQLITNEAGRALYTPEQRQMIGELRDLYRKLIVPKDGKNWSNTAPMLAPVIEAVGGRVSQAVATGVAHIAGAGLGTAEGIGWGVSKIAQRLTHRKEAREVAKQLPLIGDKLKNYQKALAAYNKADNALTQRQLKGAAASLTAATQKIGVDLSRIPTLQLPGAVGAGDENTPQRAAGGSITDPFDAPAEPAEQGLVSKAVQFAGQAAPPLISQGLRPLWEPNTRAAFMEGFNKSGQAGLKSYGEAIENQYVPEGAVKYDDSGQYYDKDDKPLTTQYRPNILPITRSADRPERIEQSGGSGWGADEKPKDTGWFNSGFEGAMPAMADVWNTIGAPAKASTAALQAAARSGGEGRTVSQGAQALREGQDVYHGTKNPTFDKFNRESPDSTIDRMLGTHVAPDPEISNTFARKRFGSGDWARDVPDGGVYPLRIPEDAKFLDVPNPMNRFDQTAVEEQVMAHAFKKDPEMLARYLEQARRVPAQEAREAADYLSQGHYADWSEGKYNLEGMINNWGGRPYNKEDRRAAVELFKKDMQEQGYAGLRYKNTSPEETKNATNKDSYIVFDPGKHLQNRLTGAFMTDSGGEGRVASQAAQALRPEQATFYSAAERAIEGAKQAKATPEQWLGWLRNQPGVTKEEIEHLGLEEWAKPKPGANRVEPVTKEQLLQHAKERGLGLQEEVRGGSLDEAKVNQVVEERLQEWLRDVEENYPQGATPEAIEDFRASVREDLQADPRDVGGEMTRFHDWTIPGGENYREIIAQLPGKGDPKKPYRVVIQEDGSAHVVDATGAEQGRYYGPPAAANEAYRLNNAPDPAYTHAHWPGVENPLYHMRVNDRKIPVEPTPEYKAALKQYEEAQSRLAAIHSQQTELAVQIYNTAKPLNAAQRTRIYDDLRARKITAGEAQRQMEQQGLEHTELKPFQDKLQALRAQESEIRKNFPKPPEPPALNTLHLEELQSDWHQAGRKKGYANPEAREKAKAASLEAEEALDPFMQEQQRGRWSWASLNELYRQLREISPDILFPADLYPNAPRDLLWQYHDAAKTLNGPAGVPDAPFKKNWAELGLRNALIKAVQEGKDAISWTPGAEQAKRYNLSKHIDELILRPYDSVGKYRLEARSKDGRTLIDRSIHDADDLAEAIGKEPAERLLSGENKERLEAGTSAKLEGAGLEIGGEGMKAFYDKMLVNKMNDIGKKFGAKVEWKPLPGAEEGAYSSGHVLRQLHEQGYNINRPEWDALSKAERLKLIEEAGIEPLPGIKAPVFKITPELREHIIKKGMPLFSESGGEGKVASQAAQAARHESEYGKGWFYNPKNNALHGIESGDLGPHGDHDGWISVGENAKKLGIDERQAGAFQTATWGPRLETTNPYTKKLIEQLPAEAKKDDWALYDWFEDNRYEPQFEKLFEKVFGMDSNSAVGATPELVRIRRWPGRKGEQDTLSIINSDGIEGSPRKFLSTFMKDNPNALDGVRQVWVQNADEASMKLTPEQFLSGKWNRKDAQFRADSGGEGKVASQAANALEGEVLYHGTSKDKGFRRFKDARNGTWFTTDPKTASQYAVENDSRGFKWENGLPVRTNEAARVVPMRHSFENTLELKEWPKELIEAENYKRAQGLYFDKLRAQGYDSVRVREPDGHATVVALDNSKLQPHFGGKLEKGVPAPLFSDSGGEGKVASVAANAWEALSSAEKKEFREGAAPYFISRKNPSENDFAKMYYELEHDHDPAMIGLTPKEAEAFQTFGDIPEEGMGRSYNAARNSKAFSDGLKKLPKLEGTFYRGIPLTPKQLEGVKRGQLIEVDRPTAVTPKKREAKEFAVMDEGDPYDPFFKKSRKIPTILQIEGGSYPNFSKSGHSSFAGTEAIVPKGEKFRVASSLRVGKQQFVTLKPVTTARKGEKVRALFGDSGGEGKLASQAGQQQEQVPGPVAEEDDGNAPAAEQRAAGGRVVASNIERNPSDAQKSAGNYAKDKVHLLGMLITIENAKGQKRKGKCPDGSEWECILPAHYGYINGSVGADKDHVDVYVGPHTKAPHVFVIDQRDAETGKFDEHKSMIGFGSERQALQTYLKGFSDGKGSERFAAMKRMTVPEFKKWVFSSKAKQPIA